MHKHPSAPRCSTGNSAESGHPGQTDDDTNKAKATGLPARTSRYHSPFLKYAGGKQRLLSQLLPLIPSPTSDGRFIEPFLGAGSVLMNVSTPHSLAGDANADLIALWAAVQARPYELIEAASRLFCPANHSQAAYLRIRHEFNTHTCRFERAVRLLYLNRFGFNGLYRVNRKGELNVPYGHPKLMPRLPAEAIAFAATRLEHVALHAGGFRHLLEEARSGDVVYCDPPYLGDGGESSFTGYTTCQFTLRDHEQLLQMAVQATRRGAIVAISNHDNQITRDLYQGLLVHELQVHQSVAASKSNRGNRKELLVVPH
jgi:DNA adenine methylase